MCTNGLNTEQFGLLIDQIADHLKVERRWSHDLAHRAEDAGFAAASDKLHDAFRLLDEVRALLDDAKDALEDEAAGAAVSVTVELV